MHYLDFLAEKLTASCQNQSQPLSSLQEEMRDGESALADSFRRVLEKEVAAGRLQYNALHSAELLTERDNDILCFPEWADHPFSRDRQKQLPR